jgi:hypothetical protein
MKKRNRNYWNIVLVAALILSSILHANFKKEVNGIELTAIDLGKKEENIIIAHSDLGVHTARDFAWRGVRPVRIIVYNNTDKPVVISSNDSMVSGVPFTEALQLNVFQVSLLLTFVFFGALSALVTSIVAGLEYDLFHSTYPYYTMASGALGLAFSVWMTSRAESYNQKIKPLLENIVLNQPVIIMPRQKVTKIIFMDLNNYTGLFTFFVLNQEKNRVASFEVEL